MSHPFSRIQIQDMFDRDPAKFEPYPRRAWAIIFFAAMVAGMSVLTAHLYFYLYMRTDSSFKLDDSSLSAGSEVKLNRSGLMEVTNMLEVKKAQFQNLLVSSSPIADPSIELGRPQPAPPVNTGTITSQQKTPKKTTDAPSAE